MSKSSRVVGDGLFERARGNPLLTPERWPYRINAVMNAAATTVGDDTLLLCRVEDRRGFSHLTIARSRDGVSNWVVDDHPFLEPSPDHPEEQWGVEDPRITRIDELDAWVIAYTAFGPGGPAVALATTQDFVSVKRLGVVCSPEDKNASLLPRRVDGEFVMFHRPVVVDRRPGRRLDLPIGRPAQLERTGAGLRRPAGRLVGLGADRGRAAAAGNRGGLAGRLPRRAADRGRCAVPGRPGDARPGEPGDRHQAV